MAEPAKLSLNTATWRPQWSLRQDVDGCLRHGTGGMAPWRDKLHETGVEAGALMIRDAGLAVTGLCRGGWYTAEGALPAAVLDDNRRAVDEASGHRRRLPRHGRGRPAARKGDLTWPSRCRRRPT